MSHEDTESAQERLRKLADEYEQPDGEAGPRGYGVWGWRDIARHLRQIADTLDNDERR